MTGKSSAKLVKNLGAPDQRIEEDGQTILVFRPISLNIPIPTGTPIMMSSSGFGMGTSVRTQSINISQNIKAKCDVYFILNNDQVTDWYSQGKDCPKH